jgi:histidine ammonia-lyase
MAGHDSVTLDGESLDIQTLSGLSAGSASRIKICDRGFGKIQAARRIVEKYLDKGTLCDAVFHCERLCALEMIIAAQALELGDRQHQSPADICSAYAAIRSIVPALEGDRPMGQDIENLANWIRNGRS